MFLFKKDKTDPIKECLLAARKAIKHKDVPIGAVVAQKTKNGDWTVISSAENRVEIEKDSTKHAEILAISRAIRRKKSKFLTDCTIFVSLEPCAMCATAISLSRIKEIVFLAADEKGGGILHNARVFETDKHLWKPKITKINDDRAEESSKMLKDFFQLLRKNKND